MLSAPKISIIMPVYHVEQYIARCLDSVVAQTFQDWELLVVIDGSTDGSAAIAESYAAKDARIRVIYQENKGVSAARQTGLDAATGDYLIHMDPDDWAEPDMLQELYAEALATDADVVICDYFVNDASGSQQYSVQRPTELRAGVVLRELFQQLHGSCCNKLAKRACYSKYGIRFPEGINYCEDLLVWVQLLRHAEVKVAYVPKAFYHYVQRGQGITRHYSRKLIDDAREVVRYLELYYPDAPEKTEAVNRHKMNVVHAAFEHPELFSTQEYLRMYPEVRKLVVTEGSKINRMLISLSFIRGLYKPAAFLYQLKQLIH